MENDTIRVNGSKTLVDIWIDGKVRAISISRDAIEAFLGTEPGGAMTEDDRCEFVRTHLQLVISAAKARLGETNPAANSVSVEGDQLRNVDAARAKERRRGERRKSSKPVLVERRRGDRRKTKGS
jgi:hypothetical protein